MDDKEKHKNIYYTRMKFVEVFRNVWMIFKDDVTVLAFRRKGSFSFGSNLTTEKLSSVMTEITQSWTNGWIELLRGHLINI